MSESATPEPSAQTAARGLRRPRSVAIATVFVWNLVGFVCIVLPLVLFALMNEKGGGMGEGLIGPVLGSAALIGSTLIGSVIVAIWASENRHWTDGTPVTASQAIGPGTLAAFLGLLVGLPLLAVTAGLTPFS